MQQTQGIVIDPVILGIVVSVLGVLVGILTYKSNRHKDAKAEADAAVKDRNDLVGAQASMNTRIEVMIAENRATNSNVNCVMTRMETRDQETQRVLAEHTRLIAVVSESTKSAHKRIDEHIGVPNKGEN